MAHGLSTAMVTTMTNRQWNNSLYFGDNLNILREHLADESVDLIYLDPPFNSNATYNLLFREKGGEESAAQITAFDDTWRWGLESELAYRDVVTDAPRALADMLQAMRSFLGQNDMMAYLVMMAQRIFELHRVLKPTGSIYLHCDPTASHYLKLLLDAAFGSANFRREIIWQRSRAHGGASAYNRVHDAIFYYSKTEAIIWNPQYQPHDPDYIENNYGQTDENGRRYQLVAAHGAGQGPARRFVDRIIEPPPRRHWAWTQDRIDELMAEGRIVFTGTGMPRYKRYLDDTPGRPLTDVWTDIPPIHSQARERLGYPTQKPEALLERIVRASSNEGDVVLDPFCGCGTATAAAERLNRRWIGIDITHLAIALIRHRLHDSFGDDLRPYDVIGDPKDLAGAQALAQHDRYQFEWWALGLVDARPAQDKRRGADSGIDGYINFFDDNDGRAKRVIVQVKSGNVSVSQIRDLKGVLEREQAQIGIFITLTPPTNPMRQEALATGVYVPERYPDHRFPRMQILTIQDLLSGQQPQYPRMAPQATFRRAPRRRNIDSEQVMMV